MPFALESIRSRNTGEELALVAVPVDGLIRRPLVAAGPDHRLVEEVSEDVVGGGHRALRGLPVTRLPVDGVVQLTRVLNAEGQGGDDITPAPTPSVT